MYWVDGSIYKGEWRNGLQHGLGTITFTDGKSKKGKFENNIYIGKLENENTTLPTIKEDKEEDMAASRSSPFLKKNKADPAK